tara:strand:+ start:590 stop:1339 length:750 start_codon:yes stop_codon:yes gene_type:complete
LKKNDTILNDFFRNAFELKSHLIEFLPINENNLNSFLDNAKIELASMHPGDNSFENTSFYEDIVGDKHLADLAAWHLTSKEYIASTLKLQQIFSKNLVLDFGGGIGTHALANAMSENVEHVFFVDINQTNREFVEFRAKKLGLEQKISFHKSIEDTNVKYFDLIVCLDVLEHLDDPALQINTFHKIMLEDSISIFNWYFYKGDNNEYPFHVDDEKIISKFFETLQYKFIELFHPMLITTRVYKKNISIK